MVFNAAIYATLCRRDKIWTGVNFTRNFHFKAHDRDMKQFVTEKESLIKN